MQVNVSRTEHILNLNKIFIIIIYIELLLLILFNLQKFTK